MRGQWHEFNPWQMPMGTTTKLALETAGLLVDEVDDPNDVGPRAAAALHKAFVGAQFDGAAVGAAFGPGQDVW